MLERVWRKGNPLALLVGMYIDTATMENSTEVPSKTKHRTTIWPSNPTTGHIPWENHNSKRVMYHNVHCSSVYNNQDMEAVWVSLDRWMDKEDVTRIYNGILLSHKKKWNWVICSEVDGPRVCHTEWSNSEREEQIPYANTYIWNLKKKGHGKPRGKTGIKTQTY